MFSSKTNSSLPRLPFRCNPNCASTFKETKDKVSKLKGLPVSLFPCVSFTERSAICSSDAPLPSWASALPATTLRPFSRASRALLTSKLKAHIYIYIWQAQSVSRSKQHFTATCFTEDPNLLACKHEAPSTASCLRSLALLGREVRLKCARFEACQPDRADSSGLGGALDGSAAGVAQDQDQLAAQGSCAELEAAQDAALGDAKREICHLKTKSVAESDTPSSVDRLPCNHQLRNPKAMAFISGFRSIYIPASAWVQVFPAFRSTKMSPGMASKTVSWPKESLRGELFQKACGMSSPAGYMDATVYWGPWGIYVRHSTCHLVSTFRCCETAPPLLMLSVPLDLRMFSAPLGGFLLASLKTQPKSGPLL